MWIDSHCHCTDSLWQEEAKAQELFGQLAEKGCEALIQGGVDPEEWELQRQLKSDQLKIVRVYGLHPWTILQRSNEQLERDFTRLSEILPEAAAIGEIGVDFVRGTEPQARQKQRDWLARQLQLAVSAAKPAVLHVVRAYPEAWHEVKKLLPPERGMIHSFWASLEKARPFLDAGWILSLHPRILHFDPHGVLDKFPRAQLVFESDAPMPLPDGSYTSPEQTLAILERVATKWQISREELAAQQKQILAQLFKL